MPALNQSLDEARKQYGEAFQAFLQALAGLLDDYRRLVEAGMVPSPGDWSEMEEEWNRFAEEFSLIYADGKKRNTKRPTVLDELAKAAKGLRPKTREDLERLGFVLKEPDA